MKMERPVNSEQKTTGKKLRFAALKKFLLDNADSIQKLATKHHKDYLGGGKFRSEIIGKYQKNHIKIVEEFANNLEVGDIKKGTSAFKKLGATLAKDSVKDNLTLEEAVDGTIFLKHAVWQKLDEEGMLDTLTAKDFYQVSQAIGVYCDVVASKIAFTYHEDYIKKIRYEASERIKTEESIQIAREYAESIVNTVREPLQRLHTREEYPGTGIGLAVCKKIIERHNGEIWIDSEEGKRATFSFSIPDNSSSTEIEEGGDRI